MWVGFFWKKPREAQVQQLYEVSMPQKCAVCYLFHGPKNTAAKVKRQMGLTLTSEIANIRIVRSRKPLKCLR